VKTGSVSDVDDRDARWHGNCTLLERSRFGLADNGLYSIRSLSLSQRYRHVLADRDLQPYNEEHWLERFCLVGQTRRHVFRVWRGLHDNLEHYCDSSEPKK
jgi:hypothetical protein